MRIGFFTDTYTPLVDGVVRSILSFREALEVRGHTVYVFAPEITKDGRERYGGQSVQDDERVFRFSALDSVFLPGYPLAVPVSLRASVSIPKLKLDIVHSHSPVTLGLLADLVAFLANIPKVYTYHTYYSEYSREYILGGQDLTPKMIETYERLYMSRSDCVVTPSQKLATILDDQYKYKGDLEIISTGLLSHEFTSVRSDLFLEAFPDLREKRLLLFAGRLGGEKNVSFLVRAMRTFCDQFGGQHKDVVFVIAGTGKDQGRFQQEAADLIGQGRVVFTGVLPREQMLSAFVAAKLFLFASKTDTQALVLSESVALGTPVVMVEDPGLSPAIAPGKTALLAPEQEAVFAETIQRALSDDDLYTDLVQGCHDQAPTLSMDRSIDALLDVYERSISEHHSYSWRSRARDSLLRTTPIRRLFPGISRGRVNLQKALRTASKRLDESSEASSDDTHSPT